MREQLEKVFEFNKEGKQDVTHIPRMISSKDFILQHQLIAEEFEELVEAFDNDDIVEVLDALVDIQYVLLGMVCRFGLQDEFVKGFDIVHDNNMSKIYDENGNKIVKFREDGKVLKPSGYIPVNLTNNFPYLKTITKDDKV